MDFELKPNNQGFLTLSQIPILWNTIPISPIIPQKIRPAIIHGPADDPIPTIIILSGKNWPSP